MAESTELRRALEFVSGRIEREATRSGEPLNDEQRFLLDNLPAESAQPAMDGTDPESPPLVSLPRDLAYERLIALAREARRHDLQADPASDLEWTFAYLISKMNRHPIVWLLEWAGMRERRPWWDRPLLVASALLFVGITTALVVLGEMGGGGPLRWTGIGVLYVTLLILLWLGSRRIENWHLKRRLEDYRSKGSLNVAH